MHLVLSPDDTLRVVTEQPDSLSVGFYCDLCAQQSGRRRMLGVASQSPTTFGGWDVWIARRVGRAPHPEGMAARPSPLTIANDGGVPHGVPEPIATAPGRRLVLIPISPLTPAAQFICRRKVPRGQRPHRPRVARTKLVELAEQAVAAGRRDAYV